MASEAAHDHVTGENTGSTPSRPATKSELQAAPINSAGQTKSRMYKVG